MDIGALISQKRKQADMTIEELSERSGVPKGTLNKIIGGITRDPQLETVKAIAKALGCTLEDFDDEPRPRTISHEEYSLIERYRMLDQPGKEIVKFLIEKECERLSALRDG